MEASRKASKKIEDSAKERRNSRSKQRKLSDSQELLPEHGVKKRFLNEAVGKICFSVGYLQAQKVQHMKCLECKRVRAFEVSRNTFPTVLVKRLVLMKKKGKKM